MKILSWIISRCKICGQSIVDDGWGWKHDGWKLSINHDAEPEK